MQGPQRDSACSDNSAQRSDFSVSRGPEREGSCITDLAK
jgi:hypothetical protein